ncbi:ROK family protein [Actinoplanes bogorensis]|uniref:ROK family protein n=1 Tax=Paractinoplanes bogorensis TaxID=1610840 RepID=A0ABS5YLE3_9ACTN|nr:ROK family protein [Actinoplanes bogorensis]MBU2664223.1 ROK family protein [Actinoplanes bogorensis]
MTAFLTTDERVQSFVAHSAGVTRADLVRELRVATPTVISAVRRLLGAGTIVEDDGPPPGSTRGRPSRRLHAPGPAPRLGLLRWSDGVARTTLIGFDGTPLAEEPLDDAGDLDAAAAQIRRLAGAAPVRAMVVSVPAPLLSTGGAQGVPSPKSDAHGFPILVENDANLAALGEQHHGGAATTGDFVYLKLTNREFGAAIVTNGRLVRGTHGYAGEIAHLQIDADGPLCACGGRGCLRSQVHSLVVDTAQAAYEHAVTFAGLAGLAATGNAGAARILHDIGRTIGRPLAQLCTFLDPATVIVDDTIGAAAEPIAAGLRSAFTTHAPPAIAAHVPVAVSTLGPSAERQGALELTREPARTGHHTGSRNGFR